MSFSTDAETILWKKNPIFTDMGVWEVGCMSQALDFVGKTNLPWLGIELLLYWWIFGKEVKGKWRITTYDIGCVDTS
jgi:hypothetical protein